MSIQEKNKIKVYNYGSSQVAAQGRVRSFMFDGAVDGVPSFETMSFDDIEWINSKSPVFRNGVLRFDDSEEADIFDALGVSNYSETLLTEEGIVDMVTHASIENVERVIAMRDIMQIERLRGYAVYMHDTGDTRLSSLMYDVIGKRFREVNQGVMVSRIEVSVPAHGSVSTEQLDAVLEQNRAMQEQMAAQAAQLAELQAALKKATAKPRSTTKPKTSTAKTKTATNVEAEPAEPVTAE